jgi:pimeloyl-ACP methyl ester carboxylesterase
MDRDTIVARKVMVEGVRLHYLTAGRGPTLILLHGYTQTSRMWRAVIPLLAERFTVIAPDLPGIGDSALHSFPPETEKLVLMDAFLPGVAGWETAYNHPGIWHFRFNGPTPEALVRGRERVYFEHFWNDFAADKKHSLSKADRAAYAAAYARPGRMRAGWAYFVSFGKAAEDFTQLSQMKLPMPALAIGGEKANGEVLGQQLKLVASDPTVVVLENTGHWVLEENPKGTTDTLMSFL